MTANKAPLLEWRQELRHGRRQGQALHVMSEEEMGGKESSEEGGITVINNIFFYSHIIHVAC